MNPKIAVSPQVVIEIRAFLQADERLAGEIYRLMQTGVTSPKELARLSSAANTGVISNNKQIITCLLEGSLPTSAYIAAYVVQAIKRFSASNQEISNETEGYLNLLRSRLESLALDKAARVNDQIALEESSNQLKSKAESFTNAIYVYSFPTYLHFGTVEDPEVKWLKIGKTIGDVRGRVASQNRQTSMPEDPVVVRVYHSDSIQVDEVEKQIHEHLESMGHIRSSAKYTRAGTEWFATTIRALDSTARLLKLQIESEVEF